MKDSIHEVDFPKYLTKAEIEREYWGKQIILTNIRAKPDGSEIDGGIVRYHAKNSMSELWGLLSNLIKTEGDDALGSCGVRYVGDIHMNLYVGDGS